MKFFTALTILALALVLGAVAHKCPIPCTRELNPTCGFNGSCYRKFGSPCFMDLYNCENEENFVAVPPGECATTKLRCNE
ncbi:turripeptide Pal9.2-like [Hermetia illucens]|uniref:turripeptide Pal9.2-like n=1 Tax=Hermetia illucens TaxID=343691 RepID=UPI0018CC5619|nr:turripeptide Pal9.2-like [Hermetia illucens]